MNATTLRQTTIARLKGRTAAGDRVEDSRMKPWPDTAPFPALAVYTPSGTREAQGPRTAALFLVTERVEVEATVDGATDEAVALALDVIEGQVTTALLGDDDWVDQFESVSRVSCERGRDGDSSRLRGAVRVGIEVKWRERWVTPAEDDFTKLHVNVDLQPMDERIEAQAEVTLEGA